MGFRDGDEHSVQLGQGHRKLTPNVEAGENSDEREAYVFWVRLRARRFERITKQIERFFTQSEEGKRA